MPVNIVIYNGEPLIDLSGDTVTPIDIFVAGHGSMVNGAEEAKVDEEGNLDIDYAEIVRYMNWIKK